MDEKLSINCKGLGDLSGDKSPVSMYEGMMQASDKMPSPSPAYTMPGVLNFLQSEWAKMKFERGQWEIERAELQARIAFLQGERKGQENLKQDLVRRIKMLEYALKQERLKFQRWKHGEAVSKEKEENGKLNDDDEPVEEPEYDLAAILAKTTEQVAASNAKWKESRTKLRQYLQEVGFTDNVVDARQARLRDIMGGVPSQMHDVHPDDGLMNGEYYNRKLHLEDQLNISGLGQGRQNDTRRLRDATNNSSEGVSADGVDDEDAETRSVLDKFNFLSNEDRVNPSASDDDEEESALEEFDILVSHDAPSKSTVDLEIPVMDVDGQDDDEIDAIEWSSPETLMRKLKAGRGAGKRATLRSMLASLNAGEDEIDMSSHVESLNESDNNTSLTSTIPTETADTVGRKKPPMSSSPQDWQHMLGLGDLASLTVANEAEEESRLREGANDNPVPSSPSSAKNTVRRTWSVRYALRSHFDAVRALTFHPTEPCMISASEDSTLKLWTIKAVPIGPPVSGKKPVSGPGCDLEPCYTFRGHDSPVLCVRFADNGHRAYSSDLNGNLREWLIPERLTQAADPETGSTPAGIEEGVDLYEPFKMSAVHGREWRASHAVWSFVIVENLLISCAADGVIAIWNLERQDESENITPPLIDEVTIELEENVHPTSMVSLPIDGDTDTSLPGVLVGLSNGNVLVMDLREKKPVMTLELTREEDDGKTDDFFTVNCIAVHPLTTNLVAVGYEDRRIRFFDLSDGKCLHSMVAHLDSVTCLDIDPSGLYLVSGSHDCSLRVWNFETRACIQEITSHRKKFGESIHAVAFHPTRALMSSGGADATARVFIS